MAERLCPQCGKAFDAVPSSRKIYCGSTCRVRHHDQKPPAGPKPRAKRADYRIRDQVTRELKEAGRESTSLGMLTISLASNLAQPGLTSQMRVSLSQELRRTLEAAMVGARKKTGVDELKERRNGKRSSARRSASG